MIASGGSAVGRAPPAGARHAATVGRTPTRLHSTATGNRLGVPEISSEAAGGTCPFSALSRVFNGVEVGETVKSGKEVPFPGPNPLSWDSLVDVATIFTAGGLHAAQLHFHQKYGHICRFANPSSFNGATSWVFINSPDNIQHVCATNVRNFTSRYLPDVYQFVTHGKGILGSQGDYNARHRRLCQPPFRAKQQLQTFADVVVRRATLMGDIWEDHLARRGEGEGAAFVTDVALQTQRLTLDVVGLTAFSHDFQQVEAVRRDLAGSCPASAATAATAAASFEAAAPQQERGLVWAVNTFGEVLGRVFITPLPLLQLMDRFGDPHLSDLRSAMATMRGAMLGVISERRAALAAGAPPKEDLLGELLGALDEEGRPLTDEELWEDVHDVMGAGHETTATSAAAVIYCVSAHPEVEQRIAAELQRELGSRPPTYADLERLPLLRACVKEALRLYPPIPVFPRVAAARDVLPSGHPVNAGDVVFMSSYALGRCPQLWPDPLAFNPDRFAPEEEASLHRFQWLPFGAGPRMCLGAPFALMSVGLMAATLLQRFRFVPVRPSEREIPVAYDITMNFSPTNGLHMRVEQRCRDGGGNA